MNQEQVIEWAREAGLIFNEELGTEASKKLHRSRVERFAALVAADAAAKERKKHQADIELWKGEAAKAEKWRAVALAKDPMHPGKAVQLIQCEAAAYEREACAQACEEVAQENRAKARELMLQQLDDGASHEIYMAGNVYISAIRARCNKEGV